MRFVGKVYSDNEAESAVSSSNPKELIVLIYERVLDQLQSGKFELSQGNFGINFFSRASDLINFGLLATLDFNKGGEIAINLKLIYEWALRAINEARIKTSPEKIQEVIDVLTSLHEAWQEIV